MQHLLKRYSHTLMLLLCALSTAGILSAQTKGTVTIKGETVERNSRVVYLLPKTMTIRSDEKISIPIRNNRFEYTFTPPNMETYELVFQDEYEEGTWFAINFFPDSSTLLMKLYPKEKNARNLIIGGAYNRAYNQIKQQLDDNFSTVEKINADYFSKLSEEQKYSLEFIATLKELRTRKKDEPVVPIYEKMETLRKTGAHLSDTGKVWMNRLDSIAKAKLAFKYNIISTTPHPAHFYLIYEDLLYRVNDHKDLLSMFDNAVIKYSELYPDMVYTALTTEKMNSLKNIYPGKNFIDVTAEQVNGDTILLSSLMKHKITLLNLWGSWCGPCIEKTQKVKPLYDQYQSKGFGIIGIAREFKDTKAMYNRIQKDNYNWVNLIELNDRFGIWNKYGIQNAAGMQLLVDEQGKILIVNPTAEEVEQVLKKQLN
ncbi:TlpA family protein disulfide reductase [Gynurincola endophyticus]|uniref:TlpA family protein disulfide reductase n=1 Tax=Gynurincola endophyticus TaxID=2479004 RepID=UPI000F8D8263|nr:TlpA disulfide reductase family protein [Gynurincola endophyticus]